MNSEFIQVLLHLVVWLIAAPFFYVTVYGFLKKKEGSKWGMLKGFGLGTVFATAVADILLISGLTPTLIVVIITTISLLIIEIHEGG